jgi:hypothetical protein
MRGELRREEKFTTEGAEGAEESASRQYRAEKYIACAVLRA